MIRSLKIWPLFENWCLDLENLEIQLSTKRHGVYEPAIGDSKKACRVKFTGSLSLTSTLSSMRMPP